MILKPASIEDLQCALKAAEKPVECVNLSNLASLVNHVPEDMTAIVQAGMMLSEFQTILKERGQWLPVDPPCPKTTTIAEVINDNLNGPRRYGFGTIRDWLIGIRFVLPDGRLVYNGGNVVKNVAGFDLCKLLVGSRNVLGVTIEATFKLSPLPEKESVMICSGPSLSEAVTLISKIHGSSLIPTVLDLVQQADAPLSLVVGFSGAAADVDVQCGTLKGIGDFAEGDLSYDKIVRDSAIYPTSVPPAKLYDLLQRQTETPWVARAGNGILYTNTEPPPRTPSLPEQRIKQSFDPQGILPAL